jgi:HEAT repeat protein
MLGQIGPAAAPATDALTGLVAHEHSKVASEAALALAKIGAGAKSSIKALVTALEKPDCDSAHAIIYALGKFGSDAAAAKPVLVKHIASDPSVAVLSAWALTQVAPAAPEVSSVALPALIAGLADPAPETRHLAAQSLVGVKPLSAAAIAALEKAAQDANQGVREAATEALRAARAGSAK